MFTSKRKLFSSERGAATSWLAGITSAALILAAVALPATATEGDGTTVDPAPIVETTTPEAPAVESAPVVDPAPVEEPAVESTPAEDPAPVEEPAVESTPAEEVVIGYALEDEAPAGDALDAPAADDPAPASDEPAPAPQPAAPVDSGASSSTDGTTPDNNSPPLDVKGSDTPSIASELADYLAGSTVNLTGSGWSADSNVNIVVNDTYGSSWKRNVTVAVESDGSIRDSFTLPIWFVSDYDVTATGLESGNTATTSFTDSPPSPGNLEQCDPPTPVNTATYTCERSGPNGWVTGNDDGIFYEGDTVPYRLPLENLVNGVQYKVSIEWDTTQSSKHAIDYLKTYNATMTAADPCISLSLPAGLCTTSDTYPIPADTFMQNSADWIANGATQDPGNFTAFGGDITSVSGYTTPPNYSGNTATSITIFFTAQSDTTVLAWGGHISERKDWGLSAVAISGSPYHMRFLEWFDITNNAKLTGGNQDRSMSADAVIYPGSITIIKDALANGTTSFPFTATPAPLSSFSLVDDGTASNTKVFSDIKDFKSYSVTESPIPDGWALDSVRCSVTSPNGGSQTVAKPTVTINLKEGENVTCTFTNSVTRLAGDPLTVTKTATTSVNRLYKWKIDKSVDATRIEVAGNGTATFNYSVKATPDGYTDSGWKVKGTVTVTNKNPFAVPLTSWADAIKISGPTCSFDATPPTQVPGATTSPGTASANYTCTLSAATAGTNTATVTYPTQVQVGPLTYTFPGTATGEQAFSFANPTLTSETNKVITVIDDKTNPASPVTLGTRDWSAGEHTFTYALNKTGTPGQCVDYTNTAFIDLNTNGGWVTGEPKDTQLVTVCAGADLVVTKDAAGSYDRLYKWKIDKSVDDTRIEVAGNGTATFNYSVKVTPDGYTDSGRTLAGTITVSNPNRWQDVTLTNVVDVTDAGWTCTVDKTGGLIVPKATEVEGKWVAGTKTFPYSCTAGATPEYAGTNTATATWNKDTFFTPTGTDDGTSPLGIALDQETNKVITVIDDKTNPASPVTLGTWDWSAGEHTFTYALNKTGTPGQCVDYTNTAFIDLNTNGGWVTGEPKDTQLVTVCAGADLVVTKDAAGSYDRTYLWTIDKKVNGESSASVLSDSLSEPDKAFTESFDYTVTAQQTGYTDSGWNLRGTITVSNPNLWEAVTLTDVTDVAGAGWTCTVDKPAEMVVPKATMVDDKVVPGTLGLTYSCEPGADPIYTGTNTATATWDKAEASTPNGSASGSAGFELVQAGATNRNVQVVDTLKGTLGTLEASDKKEDLAKGVYNYTLAFPASVDQGKCLEYPNTARVIPAIQVEDRDVAPRALETAGTEEQIVLASATATAEVCTGTLDKSADPADGTAVEKGQVINYKIVVTNPSGEKVANQTLVDTVPAGATVDVGSITPTGTYNAAARTITWTFDLAAATVDEEEKTIPGSATFTYKATVDVGYTDSPVTLVNTALWVERDLSDSTSHPVKAIKAAVTSFCVKDAPYYSLTITPQNGKLFSSQAATVRWYQANAQGQPIDAQGNPTTDPAKFVAAYDPNSPTKAPYVDTYTLTDGAFSLPQALWKGAAVDASGAATVWPGWTQPSPGVWQQVDSGGVRPGMFAVVSVNPTAQTTALYPPAASPCANPPGVPKLDKTANPTEGTTVAIGQTINYSILVTNTGGSTFTGPMVDTLPAGVTVNGTMSDGGVLNGNTITWQVTLEAGACKTFTYPVLVGTTATGNLVNTVVLTTPAGSISDSTVHPVAVVAAIQDEEVVAAEEEEIAATGANNVGNMVGAALLAMLAGGFMVTFGRRRRNQG